MDSGGGDVREYELKAWRHERIVYVSILAAATNATFKAARDDFHTEERARATGASCTFLRPSLYFELLPTLCSAEGVIENSAGDGRVACVSHDDVADVAEVVVITTAAPMTSPARSPRR